jgi:cysteine desulfurase
LNQQTQRKDFSNMIYFDHAATTQVRPEAAQVAYEVMTQEYGNPSASYGLGKAAATRREEDRKLLAKTLGCRSGELYFTSCGTEGDNWAIYGALEVGKHKGKHIITTAIEHAAVMEPMKALAQKGYEVTWLAPNENGTVDLEELKAALRPDTVLVSMMLVNNELGSILPVAEAVKIVKASGSPALFHTDAVQGYLKVPFTVKSLGVDLLTISGHKIGAPKGIGALYVKNGVKWKPLMLGGGQESGMRPGTEPTAQIAAFAKAAQLGDQEKEAAWARMKELKAYTVEQLSLRLPEAVQVVQGEAPHILCLSLPGYKSEVMVRVLGDQGICVSAGSACHRGGASHVFHALPVPKAVKDGAFRVSFGPENTQEEVDKLVDALVQVKKLLFPTLS